MLRVAIYCRVSTDDQNCDRQVSELMGWAERRGDQIVKIYKETASGAKNDRVERKKILALAHKRQINAVLISELSRWGRSTEDLLHTVTELADNKVSLLAMNGHSFDISNATGKLILTMLSAISQFERDLLAERIRSGIANARRKNVPIGRPIHVDRSEVLALVKEGKPIRTIAQELGISPTTVQKIKNSALSAV